MQGLTSIDVEIFQRAPGALPVVCTAGRHCLRLITLHVLSDAARAQCGQCPRSRHDTMEPMDEDCVATIEYGWRGKGACCGFTTGLAEPFCAVSFQRLSCFDGSLFDVLIVLVHCASLTGELVGAGAVSCYCYGTH